MKTINKLQNADNRTQVIAFAIGMAIMIATLITLAHFGVIHFDKY
jgi:hypothetical protein